MAAVAHIRRHFKRGGITRREEGRQCIVSVETTYFGHHYFHPSRGAKLPTKRARKISETKPRPRKLPTLEKTWDHPLWHDLSRSQGMKKKKSEEKSLQKVNQWWSHQAVRPSRSWPSPLRTSSGSAGCPPCSRAATPRGRPRGLLEHPYQRPQRLTQVTVKSWRMLWQLNLLSDRSPNGTHTIPSKYCTTSSTKYILQKLRKSTTKPIVWYLIIKKDMFYYWTDIELAHTHTHTHECSHTDNKYVNLLHNWAIALKEIK